MKSFKKMFNLIQIGSLSLFTMLLSNSVFAKNLLETAMDGDVKDTFDSGTTFWSIFIFVDIVLSTALAVKAKNPMVFAGVFVIAFIPGILLRLFVFKVVGK